MSCSTKLPQSPVRKLAATHFCDIHKVHYINECYACSNLQQKLIEAVEVIEDYKEKCKRGR